MCLKYYKRLLNLARWNTNAALGGGLLQSSSGGGSGGGAFSAARWLWSGPVDMPQPSLDVEELLSVAHLVSVLAKAVVLAHGAYEKTAAAGEGGGAAVPADQRTPLRLGQILRLLPPGLNSDIANSLLEALDRCVTIWRRRFRQLAILRGGAGSTAAGRAARRGAGAWLSLAGAGSSSASASAGHPPTPAAERLVPFQHARARFFRSQVHGIPTMAFLGTRGGVRDKLPNPLVVDETIRRLFA